MGITRQICQHSFGSGEGFLSVDDPVDLAQRFEESLEGIPLGKACKIVEEVQLSGFIQLGQPVQNETPVQSGQHTHGQEEVLATGDPLCPVHRQPTARHYHVDVGMMRHSRAPGMENRRDPNSCAQMLWIGSDLDHRVSTRPHQQIVERAFVLMGDICDWLGQSEDKMEVSHRQQLCFACRQPCFCGTRLTFGAMTIAARVVGDVLVCAVGAACDMPTKRRRAAAFDSVHHLELVKADVACICRAIRSTMGAEDIRNLQQWRRQSGLRGPGTFSALSSVQIVQRAVHGCDHARGNARITRCGRELGVSQQRLNDADVDAAFQKMGRKRMA